MRTTIEVIPGSDGYWVTVVQGVRCEKMACSSYEGAMGLVVEWILALEGFDREETPCQN